MSLPNILLSIFSIFYLIGIGVILYHLMRFGVGHELEDKKPYENIIVLLRRHWFVLFMQIVAFILIGLIPPVILQIFKYVEVPDFAPWKGVALIIYYLIWSYGLFFAITMYLLDVWIVTDHRVIDSEQHGFFARSVAELNLYRIQDISIEIKGVIPTFLDYGGLEIQTAGTSEKFFFKQIPNPNHVKDMVMDAHHAYVKTHPNDIEVHETQ